MDVVSGNTLLPGDPRLIDHIVCELKSQGIFDQFRKECIADVDTKPAYQNLRQRVEGSVTGFLKTQIWRPDMNKNQLREALRKNIYESGFLETGVERIVDQVVNPKINAVFLPQVEDVVYKFLGLEKPIRNNILSNGPLTINTIDLLPTDLDPISPDSEVLDKTLNKSNETANLDDSKQDDFESPPFEPITDQNVYMQIDESSNDSKISGISGLTSHDSNLSAKDTKIPGPDINNPDSQLSKVSSNSRLSIITNESTKHMSEKMDISDDTQSSKDDNSNSFIFEHKITESFLFAQKSSENGFFNIQQEIKDELEAIRMEINGCSKQNDEVLKENDENLNATEEVSKETEKSTKENVESLNDSQKNEEISNQNAEKQELTTEKDEIKGVLQEKMEVQELQENPKLESLKIEENLDVKQEPNNKESENTTKLESSVDKICEIKDLQKSDEPIKSEAERQIDDQLEPIQNTDTTKELTNETKDQPKTDEHKQPETDEHLHEKPDEQKQLNDQTDCKTTEKIELKSQKSKESEATNEHLTNETKVHLETNETKTNDSKTNELKDQLKTNETKDDLKINETKDQQKPDEKTLKTNEKDVKIDDQKTIDSKDQKLIDPKDQKTIEKKEETKDKDRHRHDSDRKRDKDRKSDRDKKYSSSSKSSSSSSSKDKDRHRDKSKDSKSKDKDKESSSSSKSKEDKDKSSKSSEKKSSSSKHSSRDRSRTDSKSDSKSSKDHSSSRKDPKKSDDSRKNSEKSDVKPDEVKSRKSDSKSNEKSSREHSRNRDYSRDSSSKSSKDKKTSSRDKKESKDSKESKKSSKKDDHSSSKDKKDSRRSADRDSNDGSSGIGPNTSGLTKETTSSSNSSNKSKTTDTSDSNGSNDSGQSDSHSCQPIPEDQIPLNTQKSPKIVELSPKQEMVTNNFDLMKIKKPKIASNIFEARKLMKIRKKLEKIEKKRQRKFELAQGIQNLPSPTLELDNIDDTDSMDSGKLLIVENEPEIKTDDKPKEEQMTTTSVISKESWDAIEAKLSQSVNQNVDFDSYIDDNNDSSSSLKTEEIPRKNSKRLSEDEDCLYFNNQVSPTTQRFLKSVETFQKNSNLSPEQNKMAPPTQNADRPSKKPRKSNLKQNQQIADSEIIITDAEKTNEVKTGAKRKQVKGKKRKIDGENEEIYSENNNKKLNNSYNVVEIAEEFDDVIHSSPSASNGSIEITTTKKTVTKNKKTKKNASVNNDSFPLPLSPESDKSGNTVELRNKMADDTPPARNRRSAALKNQPRSQRYSSDDLYKPRPFVSGSRRQRGMLNSTDKK